MHCDNETVVEVLQKGCARDGDLMHLLRCVFFITAFYEMSLKAVHIPGTSNTVADAISSMVETEDIWMFDSAEVFDASAQSIEHLSMALPG